MEEVSFKLFDVNNLLNIFIFYYISKRKYLRKKEQKDNVISQTERKVIPTETKPVDNSYLHRVLQNSNKPPQSGAMNLNSYNENLSTFRVSIRDILSKEENKQKAINYVIQKRNEDKYGKRNILMLNIFIVVVLERVHMNVKANGVFIIGIT